jgi:cob(I)alamin adenosyltransferase
MAKSNVYTRTGDSGSTSLVGGKRVSKTHPRIEAYGTIDELNAFLACLLDDVQETEDRAVLLNIQYHLFTLGAYLATEDVSAVCQLTEDNLMALEQEIDKIDAILPSMKSFVLPGGCKSNALAHVCRTVCRRAERAIYALADTVSIDPVALRYVNRLSDYLFVLSRKQSLIQGVDEIKWEKPCI